MDKHWLFMRKTQEKWPQHTRGETKRK